MSFTPSVAIDTVNIGHANGKSSSNDTDWWPMFRHDLQHSGYSTSKAPDTNNVLWSYIPGFLVESSPAVADGRVYFGSTDDNVYCLDAYTGEYIWSYTTGNSVFSSPAVADGKVYIGSDDDNVYCLDAYTGEYIWSYTTGDNIWYSSPAVVDGRVYFGSDDYRVYCLDAYTGEYIWSYTTGGRVDSSPAIADGKVYIGSDDDNVYCLNADSGDYIWSYETGDQIYSSPAIANGNVYIGGSKPIGHYMVYCFGDPSQPPEAPTIDGPTSGKPGIQYEYTFNATDPDGDNISEYIVDWGDGTSQETISGPFESGEEASASHAWSSQDTYTITAKAIDIYDAESNWSEFEVGIPRNRATTNLWFHWFLERFTLLEILINNLRWFLG